jgi:hypothetical protein
MSTGARVTSLSVTLNHSILEVNVSLHQERSPVLGERLT